MRRQRLSPPRAVATVLTLSAAALLASLGGGRSPALASVGQPHDTVSSAVTVQGTGPYASLKVTVAQTQNLANQVVAVSWTGAKPPLYTATAAPSADFLQLMQCWGDDPAGPDRTQCEYGGLERTVGSLGSRRVSVPHDPAEPLTTGNTNSEVYVPFVGANGARVAGDARSNTQFDSSTTNEISGARTQADGTGREYMELLTGGQSPGLGCGNAVITAGVRTGRSCWLVIVPRGETEVDGSDRSGPSSTLESSPLSETNWAQRLVVPLQFSPLGVNCALGSPEHRIYGQLIAAQAVYRWEPALCDTTGSVFGFSSINDNIARQQLVSGEPDLQLVSRPVAAADLPAGKAPVYAPVTLSAPAIVFNINSQAFSGAAAVRNGLRIDDMNLTPRLVAKLLTESYPFMDAQGLDYLSHNPDDIANDPDFLQYNPEFRDPLHPTRSALSIHPGDILLPSALSDASQVLWRYVNSDADARAWLNGAADPWGMTVNPFFKNLTIPRQDFPKADLDCQDAQNHQYCTLDRHPYSNDPFAVARSTSRGDSLTRSPNAFPYAANALQQAGSRDLFGVSDLPDASLYSLPVAKLRNAHGEFVAPTGDSLRAAVAAMTTDPATQTMSLDPAVQAPGVYPTAMVTYAATVPGDLSPQDGQAYAAFIRYAVDGGQIVGDNPGQLPGGYTPLPAALVAQAENAATILVAGSAAKPSPSAVATSPATPVSSTPASRPTPSGHVTATQAAATTPATRVTTAPVTIGVGSGLATSSAPVVASAVRASATEAASASPSGRSIDSPPVQPLLANARTPMTSGGAGRLVPIALLVIAALGLGSGLGAPLPRRGARRTKA